MIGSTSRAAISRGLTLVEVLTVLALLAVLATLALPAYQGFTDKRRLEGAAQEYVSHLQWARAHAVQTGRSVRIKVESGAQGACYVIHQGGSGACSCLHAGTGCGGSDDRPLLTAHFPADGHVRISGHGQAERHIDPLRGIFTPTGTVEFSDPRGHAVRAITNLMGRTRLCTTSRELGSLDRCRDAPPATG